MPSGVVQGFQGQGAHVVGTTTVCGEICKGIEGGTYRDTGKKSILSCRARVWGYHPENRLEKHYLEDSRLCNVGASSITSIHGPRFLAFLWWDCTQLTDASVVSRKHTLMQHKTLTLNYKLTLILQPQALNGTLRDGVVQLYSACGVCR